MWDRVLVCVVLYVVAFARAEEFIENGTWIVHSLERCEQPDQYPIDIDVQKRKINRTHDGFNMTFDLPEDLTKEGYGLHAELYKKCDGGYKFQQNFDYTSICHVANEYAKDNWESALAAANIDPPNCPIPKGTHTIFDFVIDYTKLPREAILGDFKAILNMINDNRKVTCLTVYLSFTPDEEGDEED